MRRARAQEIGRGLGVIAFFLMFTVICMSSQRRASAAIPLLFFGWLIFGCAACGAMQMPLRELPIGAWGGMFLGLGLMALGALWCFIYESPWADALTAGMLVAALATLAIGQWMTQRGAD